MPNFERLGRYQIEILLGSGAYAGVYRATDTILKRVVALKILKPALRADEKNLKRFFQEAQVMAELLHPRIAWVWDIDEVDNRFLIAMRYIAGASLGKVLTDQGPVPWTEALNYIEQVSEALNYAHRKGLVHRDVKPQNIIISPEEGAVLTDFGLVRAMESSGLSTRSGAILGTPQYIAPEVWLGEEATPATDQYALACVLAEMLTGHALFAASTPPAVMRNHFEPIVFSRPWPPDMPQEIVQVLQKALAKEPQERYAQVAEFTRELRAAAEAPQRLAEQQLLAIRRVSVLAEAERNLAEKDWLSLVVGISQLLADDPHDATALNLVAHLKQGLQLEEAVRAQHAMERQVALLAIEGQKRQKAEEQTRLAAAKERVRQEDEARAKRDAEVRERQQLEATAPVTRQQHETKEPTRHKLEGLERRTSPVLNPAVQSNKAIPPAQALSMQKHHGAKRSILIGGLALLVVAVIVAVKASAQPRSISAPPSPVSMAALPTILDSTLLPVGDWGLVTPTSTSIEISTLTSTTTATPVPTATSTSTATATRTPTTTPTRTATMKPSATPTKIPSPTVKATQAPKPSFPTIPPSDQPFIGAPIFNPPCGSTIKRDDFPQYPRMFQGYAAYSGIQSTLKVACVVYGVEDNGTKHEGGSLTNAQTNGVASPDRGRVLAECYPFDRQFNYPYIEFVIGLIPNTLPSYAEIVPNIVTSSTCRYTVTP